ncbi:DUF4214 domain-containing protein [Noviherbaspirillum sp. ST9]|uniref:DUF4214 domain-containing protein n=1 Tax=Noviherbaspirillum sp. ST9 TaxID=3401606 RepID=UPI003B589503
MTVFTAAASQAGVNMSDNTTFYGSIITNTTSQLTVASGSQRQDYYGSFNYSATDVFGVLTGTRYINTATGLTYTANGFTYDANLAAKYINSGSSGVLIYDVLAGNDQITGSAYADVLVGYNGNDVITGGAGNDSINGGDGIDTVVLNTSRSNVTITRSGNSIRLTDATGATGTDTLTSVERIKFVDATVALDISGSGGQAYRLYQAAFNRTPDKGGLGFHMNDLDNGATLTQIAQNFINSPEFSQTYGSLNDMQFVTQLYANVLHRGPDANGLDYHVKNLANGMSRAQTLVGFSESPENQASLIGVIQNGFEYIPAV